MIFAFLLLLSAIILLIYNTNENNRVEQENLEAVTELEKIYEENLFKENNEVQQEQVVEDKTSIKINGNDYMGIIYIPVLDNLSLPVLEKYSASNLKISICKYSGGIEEGNFVIAGHNYKSSFGKLSKLSVRQYSLF